MKKVLLFIFIFILTITNVKALKIVSLGDSIPYGYLLEEQTDSYDNRLAKTLKADYYEYSYPGMRSDELLNHLEEEEIASNIKDADIILINIGSNDLLHLLNEIDISSFNIDIESGFNSQMNIDKDTLNNIYQYLKDYFEVDLKNKSLEELEKFKVTFPAIIAKIKEYNPNIKIYVDNLYNPFFDISIPLLNYDLDFISDTSDEAIDKFNEVISSNDGYTIINMHDILRNTDYLNINILKASIDPHPNYYGHNQMYEAYLKELCYKVTYGDKVYYVLKGGSLDIKPKEKEGYKFIKWNHDLSKINKDITLKAIYKKKFNYYSLLIVIPFILLLGFVIIKAKKNS